MQQIASGKVTMKPRWYFWLGSGLAVVGLTAFSLTAVFLFNLMFFTLRRHGPMAEWRVAQIVNSFPWWALVLAIAGLGLGIWLLKKFDFSYKKNFWLVLLGFGAAIILAALLIDQLGFNELWQRRGPMRRFYQQVDFNRYNNL